jgi:O-antigen ligase
MRRLIAIQPAIISLLLFSMGAFAAFENVDRLGDNSFELAWIGVYVLFAVAALPWRRLIVQAALGQKWLLALVAWTLLSTLWSVNPSLSFRRASALACTTALGLYLGVRFNQRQLLHLIAIALAVAVLSSAVVAICFPSVGIMQDLYGGAWRGIFPHKNSLSEAAVLSLITFGTIFVAERNRRKICLLVMALIVPEILLSKSAAGLVHTAIVADIVLLFWMLRSFSRSLLVPFGYWFMGLTVALGCWLATHGTRALALIGRDPTLTGRTDLWAFAADSVRQRPWLGYGYDAFWLGPGGDAIRAAVGWDAPHSHNGFLDLSLDIGLLGTLLLLVTFFLAFRRALQYALRTRDPYRLWPLLYLTIFFLINLTETTRVSGNSFEWLLYTAISVQLCRDEGIVVAHPAPAATQVAQRRMAGTAA